MKTYRLVASELNFLQTGGGDIQIILFSDVMTGHDCWFRKNNGEPLDFVERLGRIGRVIIPRPNYVNFMRFSKQKPDSKDPNRLFAPADGNIHFTVEDMQFEKYAEWVLSQINPSMRFICIGLDQGGHFAKFFCNAYADKCIGLIVLGDRLFTKENYENTFRSERNYEMLKVFAGDDREQYKIENITDAKIDDLLKRIERYGDDKLINLLNGICKGLIRSQHEKIPRMTVPTVIYSHMESLSPEKKELNDAFAKKSIRVVYYYVMDDNAYLHYGLFGNDICERVAGMAKFA